MDSSCSGVTDTPLLDSHRRLSYLVWASRALYLARLSLQFARLLQVPQTNGACSSRSHVRSSHSGHSSVHWLDRRLLHAVLAQPTSHSPVTAHSP
jgi:hypothetical protein